ncbi:armadillo-type protein [Lipomyces oligophaga]|uniref:armadillo-type protein n=1 Tax=Lipomyces oligophaga TaxID=45792 RepID=UPI0034CFA7AB
MSDFSSQLVSLLEQVTASNNEVIKAASARLQKEFYTNSAAVPALIQIMQQNPSPQLRQLAAIEVRKLIISHWDNLDTNLQAQIKNSLFQSTLQESVQIVRHASSRVISEIAKNDLPERKWDELPAFVHKACLSSSVIEREVGVYILYTLLESMEATFIDRLGEFMPIFSQTLSDPQSLTVRTDTLLSLGKIAEILDADPEEEYTSMFRQFLPGMVNVLKELIDQGDTKVIGQAFDVFQSFMWIDSSIIGKAFGDLIQFLHEITKSDNFDSDVRCNALTCLTNAVRYKRMKVQGLRIGSTLTSSALQIAADTMDEIDDEEEEDSVPRLALRFIDILSSTLPPSQVMNTLVAEIPKYVSSPNPNYRRAGLLAISVAAEGAPDFLSTQIKFVLPVILQGLQDNTVEVVTAALSALAQLATELQEAISKEHEVLLPIVFNMMDSQDPKVSKAARNALDAMIESLDQEVIVKYLDALMTRLIDLLNRPDGDLAGKGPVIAAIGSAAHAAKTDFMPYLNVSVQAIQHYLGPSDVESELDVKGMAFDTLGAIANSCGKEAFSPYAQASVEAAYDAFQSQHSRLRESIYLFFGTLSKVYGEEFAPFLPRIMPEIFKPLDQEESGYDEPEEDIDIGNADEEDPWKNITVNTSLAIEKEIAIDTIGDLAAGTKSAFLPYMDTASEKLLAYTEHFYEGLRRAAITSLWQTVGVIYNIANPPKWEPGLRLKIPLPETVTAYSAIVMKATLESFEAEDDRSTATAICNNLSESLRLCGPGILGDSSEAIATQILIILKKQHRCQTMDDEEEEEEDGDAAEYDLMLLDSAMDVIVALAAALGDDFEHYFKTFCPIILKYCSSSNQTERASGTGALAEIVNGMKTAITPHTTQLLKCFVHRLSDETSEVRSNAVYGYGLLAQYSQSTQEIVGTYAKTFQRLQQLLTVDAENQRCVANILGCVARLCSAHMESVPLDSIIPVLITNLPIQDGFEENDPIYRLIVNLYKLQNPIIQGLTEKIVQGLEALFLKETEEKKQFEFDQTRQEVVELLRYIYNNNPSLVQSGSAIARVIQ